MPIQFYACESKLLDANMWEPATAEGSRKREIVTAEDTPQICRWSRVLPASTISGTFFLVCFTATRHFLLSLCWVSENQCLCSLWLVYKSQGHSGSVVDGMAEFKFWTCRNPKDGHWSMQSVLQSHMCNTSESNEVYSTHTDSETISTYTMAFGYAMLGLSYLLPTSIRRPYPSFFPPESLIYIEARRSRLSSTNQQSLSGLVV